MSTPANTSASSYSPSVDNLRTLLIIRSIALLGQTAVLAYVVLFSAAPANLPGVTLCLVILALVTTISLWRTTRTLPAVDNEFLVQLMIDVVGWTALMYFTGGANNPFISYYIVPLVISAAVLPWRHTWVVAGASIAAYTFLLFFYLPFPLFTPHAAMGHGDSANLHIMGMWFNFLFSAGLITYFVVRMATTLRRQEDNAVRLREDTLRNDQIMAVAGLAAGTAHELGTPLSTMAVLVDEMLANENVQGQNRKDCELLKDQLQHCKTTLTELSRTAEMSSIADTRKMASSDFAQEVLERWAVRRPGTPYEFEHQANSPEIEFDSTLGQALENLLNNAADSSTPKLRLSLHWDETQVRFCVRDWGRGIAPEMLERLGKPVLHSNKSGLGIGLMLTQATVARHGGHIQLRNEEEAGVLATLSLPLASTT